MPSSAAISAWLMPITRAIRITSRWSSSRRSSPASNFAFASPAIACWLGPKPPGVGQFLLSYTETAAAQAPHLGSSAFLFANNSLSPSYTPDPLLSDSNGANGPAAPITTTRLGGGRYDVLLPAHIDVLGVPIVGLLGTTPGVARVRDWVSASGSATKVSVE